MFLVKLTRNFKISFPNRFKSPLISKPLYQLFDSKLSQQQLMSLRNKYIQKPEIKPFKQYIQNSSDYFRVYTMIRQAPFSQSAFQQLQQIAKNIDPQTDNVILLRSKIIADIAQNYQKNDNLIKAKQLYWKSILCMQESLVPQIMQYYTLYRKYGLLLAKMQQKSQALQVLKESVVIIDQFVSASDDPVSSLGNSLRQAQAYVKLAQLEPSERRSWVNLANKQWKNCEDKKYEYIEYAQTIRQNIINQLQDKKQSINKIKLRAIVEMQMLKNPQHIKIIEGVLPP